MKPGEYAVVNDPQSEWHQRKVILLCRVFDAFRVLAIPEVQSFLVPITNLEAA